MGATTHANPRRMDLARPCRNCNAITSHRARNTVDIAHPSRLALLPQCRLALLPQCRLALLPHRKHPLESWQTLVNKGFSETCARVPMAVRQVASAGTGEYLRAPAPKLAKVRPTAAV